LLIIIVLLVVCFSIALDWLDGAHHPFAVVYIELHESLWVQPALANRPMTIRRV